MIQPVFIFSLPQGWLMCLRTGKSQGEAAICGARLLSVSRQVGAHLWHECPAGGLSGILTHNLSTLSCHEVQTLQSNPLLIALSTKNHVYKN